MDILYEQAVVKNYFVKHYQERVIFELSNKKKRRNAFDRLCHNYDELLDNRFMEKCIESNYLEIYRILKSYGASDSCYVLSYNSLIDGKYMELDKALKIAVGYGMPSLIVCESNKLAYFEAEQVQGAPPRYILRRNI